MAREYSLDTQAAKEANAGGKRITDAGPYIGKIKAAWYERNDKGTESVHFQFTSDDGREANQLALYTHNGDGKELPSYKTFNAILACLQLRNIKAQRAKVDMYDFTSGGMVTREKETYPSMCGKPIGMFFQREERESDRGEIKESLIIAGAFDATTKLMASEILGRQNEPKAHANMSAWLEKNPVKKLRRTGASQPQRQSQQSSGSYTGGTNGAGFDDDDIPF